MTSRARRTLAVLLFALAAAPLLARGGARAGDEEAAPLPAQGELNPHVLRVLASYPTDGTHKYYWPKGSRWAGTTRDLVYDGERIAEGDKEGRCYCCGLTFEVFFRAYEAWCQAKGRPFRVGRLDSAGMRRLLKEWFGAAGDERRTVAAAVEAAGIGVALERLDDARPGDFVQLWRASKTGHSVVFLGWDRGRDGQIEAIRYWSTQKSTDGIGYRTERFDGPAAVLRDGVYIARIGAPPAGAR